MARLFGTDGVRGVANSELTPELAMKIGRAAVLTLTEESGKRAKILIGKDTRVSSDMLENAIAAGICSAGADVLLLGFVPTPAVAYLVKKYSADAGVVISASHNSMEFNGIKIFNSEGFKLADEIEDRIEERVKRGGEDARVTGAGVGSVSFAAKAADDYVEYVAGCVGKDLSGIKVAVDCANGASFETAQKLFTRLNVDAVFTAAAPDGRNINDGVGSTHLDSVVKLTRDIGADIGVAFDGDADRCIAVDENGEEIDGDMIIAVLAKALKSEGRLARDTAVVTVMTNIGFVEYCKKNGITVVRTPVGDRYVLEEMLKEGYAVGGEQSGHVILLEHATSGDGQLTAAVFLSVLKESGRKASELAAEIPKYPQVLQMVAASAAQKAVFAGDSGIREYIDGLQKSFGDSVRILVRQSGTEPVIRVMVEGPDEKTIGDLADAICGRINETIKEAE